MLVDFAVAAAVAAFLYLGLVGWVKDGARQNPNAPTDSAIEGAAFKHGLWIVPLAGLLLLLLFYGARFVWWQMG